MTTTRPQGQSRTRRNAYRAAQVIILGSTVAILGAGAIYLGALIFLWGWTLLQSPLLLFAAIGFVAWCVCYPNDVPVKRKR